MNDIVPVLRTCTEVSDTNHNRPNESRPLDEFRSVPAYVLLGDPGAGKTTAFEAECEALGEKAHPITADDFLTYDASNLPSEWREKTLFIDGLDEVRTGVQGVSTFRDIRKLLRALGKPRFRLSCRQADWLGENDRNKLQVVAQGSEVIVLRLDLLTVSDVEKILNARSDIPDPRVFITTAQEKGVDGLLFNPLCLDLLAKAVVDGDWPESRKETFEMACARMVREPNEEDQAVIASSNLPTPDQLLDAAGRLCAVQLIAGVAGYTLHGQPDIEYPALDQCGDHHDRLRFALATKLFRGVSDNRFTPVHRHIAEFLGARYLSQLIDKGLPTQRVLALITGADGGVVTEMRGLSAWLAAQCSRARMTLIERDPIGVGLYGDLHQFSHDEKRVLLNALERAGDRLGSGLASRYWTAAFGPLVTANMEPALREILTDPARDEQHQMLALFVLRILEEGPPLPELSTPLFDMSCDNTRSGRVLIGSHFMLFFTPALKVRTRPILQLKRLLADIRTGRVTDPENELLGTLLTKLYPRDLPAVEVWNYLSESDGPNLTSPSFRFWSHSLFEQSSDRDVSELLDRLLCPSPGLQRALETPRTLSDNKPRCSSSWIAVCKPMGTR